MLGRKQEVGIGFGIWYTSHLRFGLKGCVKKKLAIEIKFVAANGGRMPNGEIQRLMGQCTLAKTKDQFVIGICGCRGTLGLRWDHDTQAVTHWFEQAGISLIFKTVS